MFEKFVIFLAASVWPLDETAAVWADPTQPPEMPAMPDMPAATPNGLPRLTGILISDGQPRRALLDGHLVREGQTVGNIEVVAIESTKVRVRRNGTVMNLELIPSIVRRADN